MFNVGVDASLYIIFGITDIDCVWLQPLLTFTYNKSIIKNGRY